MTTREVYLVCFKPGIPRGERSGNARHYLGSTAGSVDARVAEHVRGAGSPLVRAAVLAGCTVQLVATWPGGRDVERKMKRAHNLPRLCPRCQS